MKRLKFAFVLLCLLSKFHAHAQKSNIKEYDKIKEELDRRIFNTPDPYFKENSVPEKYKNESAVVLAQKHTLESDSKFKFLILAWNNLKYSFFDIFRRKILINDQSSLEKYSRISFSKLQSNEWGTIGKTRHYTFLNIRLIKPGGKVVPVNIDESTVIIKDENDEQQTKVAIPGLETGDIIDYYVASYYEEVDEFRLSAIDIIFEDEYPVLNYIISLQLDNRIAAEYQTINGAPDFITDLSPEGGKLLSLVVKDMPKRKELLWSSVYRQTPIIRLHYTQGKIYHSDMRTVAEGDVVKCDKQYSEMIEDDLTYFFNKISKENGEKHKFYKSEYLIIRKAWKEYISKNPTADQRDSLAPFVFRYLNWHENYNHFSLTTNFNTGYFRRDLDEQLGLIAEFAYILLAFKTELALITGTGKSGYSMENIFRVEDLSVMVRTTQGTKPQYFSFADNFDFPETIPASMDGTDIRVYPFDISPVLNGKSLYVTTKNSKKMKLPVTDYNANYGAETIIVMPDAVNAQQLDIKRTVMSWGSLKKNPQILLTTFEDMAIETGKIIHETNDVLTLNNQHGRNAAKTSDELNALLEKAEKNHKEYFEKELASNYQVKIKELKSFRVTDYGIPPEMPFAFEENFVVEGWIKKAGDNYIVDIGKLIGNQVLIDKDQRERKSDIYMPFPRSYSYHIEFSPPTGYTIMGLDKLILKSENETGGFVSKAAITGNKLIIDINKYYVNSFIPATGWGKLISFLDLATEFSLQNILLKKI